MKRFIIGVFFLSVLHASELETRFQKICDSPRIYVCSHFLSDADCDHIIQLARPSLQRTTVLNPNGPDTVIDSRRTSLGTWLTQSMRDHVVRALERQVANVTEIPERNGEGMQILYYGVGAEYQPHFDYFDPSTPGGRAHYNRGGQRVATFLVYLNTPEKGGETVFPRVNIKVTPEKGKAVLFYNVNKVGKEDPMSLHGGMPVIQGEKWLLTRWLRAGEFR